MPQEMSDIRHSLVEVFLDIFVLGYRIRHAKELGDVETFRTKLERLLEAADQIGVGRGVPRDVLLDARFAVVAFLDEMILSSGWPHRQEWATNLLQYQYFETTVAGEAFFDRLQTLRKAMPRNPDLLEVYLMCLTLGFEGKYKVHDRERLKDLQHDLFQEIQHARVAATHLSPHSQRHDEVIEAVKRELPAWVVAVGAVSAVFFFYVMLSVLIHQETADVAARLQALVAQVQ